MWRKHHIVLNNQMNYTKNDIYKPYKVGILQRDKHVRETHDIYNFLPPPIKNVEEQHGEEWKIRDK